MPLPPHPSSPSQEQTDGYTSWEKLEALLAVLQALMFFSSSFRIEYSEFTGKSLKIKTHSSIR